MLRAVILFPFDGIHFAFMWNEQFLYSLIFSFLMKAEEVDWVGKECFPCSSFTVCSKEPKFWLLCMFKMPWFHIPTWNVGLECMCVVSPVSVTYLVTLSLSGHCTGCRSFSLISWPQSNPLSLLASACSVIHGYLQ